jgi:glycosyltransferase involved in cell wall biosynthesis
MIVKNEESTLERCLSSVKNMVDEIIIIDTGSTDNTINIARKFTDRIFSFKWIDDFAAARNESLRYATKEYILVLDADEYLDHKVDLQSDLESNCDYYYVNIKNEVVLGRIFTHSTIRIFKNKINLKYENRLHEHINIVGNEGKYTDGIANIIIHHTGYTDERMKDKNKFNRNLKLMSLEVKDNPNAFNLFNMGKTYYLVSEHTKAVEYLQRAYPLSLNRMFLPELLTILAQSLFEINKIEEGISILKGGTVLFPNETEMRFTQGILYKKSEYFRDAELCFLDCIKLGDQGTIFAEGSGGYLSYLELSALYFKTGRTKESYEHMVKALEQKFISVIVKYLELTLKLNTPLKEIIVTIDRLYPINNVTDLQILLELLYRVRHPLLDYYLDRYQVEVQSHVMFVAKLYSRNYQELLSIFKGMKGINHEISMDALIYAYIFKEESMYNVLPTYLNLGSSEAKVIKKLLIGKKLEGKLTSELEYIYFSMLKKLIILKEYDLFQTLSEQLISCSEKYIINISNILSENNFDELAIAMLNLILKREPRNTIALSMIGDLYYRNKNYKETQMYYSKLSEIDSSYGTHEKLYNLYESLNDTDNALKIKREIATKFPVVSWAEESIS